MVEETKTVELKAWVAPELRRMSAGDAETGFSGGNREDAPYIQTS